MKRIILPLTLFAMALVSPVAATEFGPGTHIVNKLILRVPTIAEQQAGAKVTITVPLSVVTIGPQIEPINPPIDPPVDPPIDPPVDGTISEAVKQATAAIPVYTDKEKHQRTIAFTLTFLSQAIPSDSNPSTEVRNELHKACDLALGNAASQWSPWWEVVDSKTATMTNAQYKAAVPLIATAVTNTAPNAAGSESFGVPNFGLPDGFLAELFKILLPILLELLSGL